MASTLTFCPAAAKLPARLAGVRPGMASRSTYAIAWGSMLTAATAAAVSFLARTRPHL